jgi:hypothetical protein
LFTWEDAVEEPSAWVRIGAVVTGELAAAAGRGRLQQVMVRQPRAQQEEAEVGQRDHGDGEDQLARARCQILNAISSGAPEQPERERGVPAVGLVPADGHRVGRAGRADPGYAAARGA